ncbi:MAG: hypothetical protein GTO63_35635 [Anaerolineae bacterium]|nr:hypothetical protein [Anaerolineae bacterium]NIO00084.1 hypothetical protein [Anaerolineae bacterium]NIQ82868.1 hypothetical protein [Anaerolineae bacterium]
MNIALRGTKTKEDIKLSRRFESVSATLHEGHMVQIVFIRQYRGVDVGDRLWLGLDAVPWLIEAMEICLDTLKSSHTKIGTDSLRVKEKARAGSPSGHRQRANWLGSACGALLPGNAREDSADSDGGSACSDWVEGGQTTQSRMDEGNSPVDYLTTRTGQGA